MLHAFRLGPPPFGLDPLSVYAALDEDGELVGPVSAASDAEGLGELVRSAEGRRLRCEPALAAAGKALGLDAAELPEPVLVPRALLAFGLTHPPDGPLPLAPLHERFLEACAAVWHAAPWKAFRSSDALPLELTTSEARGAREVSVLGADGEGFGLAVYDQPGSVARVTEAMDRGRADVVRRVPGVAVIFDADPPWAAAAMEAAFDLPSAPTATRIDRRGRKSIPSPGELHALAAAIAATVALVDSGAPNASREVTIDGATVGARVERPDPARAVPARRRSARGAKVHQLLVSLKGVEPPIWRRLRVPSELTVGDLHHVLLVAFAWSGAYAHEFRAGRGVRYAPGDLNEWGEPSIPEGSISLAEALPRAGRKLLHVLEHEDGWRHEVRVERILAIDPPPVDPICLEGARAGPIDGCGGAWGYAAMLEALADPEHEDHGWRKAWAGDFDPEAFDAAEVTAGLRSLRRAGEAPDSPRPNACG
jgi:hypothetical protein